MKQGIFCISALLLTLSISPLVLAFGGGCYIRGQWKNMTPRIIRQVQEALQEKGANIKIDGKMGPITDGALQQFVIQNGISKKEHDLEPGDTIAYIYKLFPDELRRNNFLHLLHTDAWYCQNF